MDIISLNEENLAKEHICCVMKDKKGNCGSECKKKWLKERFGEGLVFKKADVRGKVFIEYIPGDKAWAPVDASDYMFINCLWVAGSYKGQGYAKSLFGECVEDAKKAGKSGIAVISSPKKKPYISEKQFFIHNGFQVCDTAPPYYELLCLKFDESVPDPKFLPNAKELEIPQTEGVVIYYSHQCPYTEDYIRDVEKIASENGIPFQKIRYEDYKAAQAAKAPSTSYSVFVNGKFVSNEILTEKSFLKKYEQMK